MAKINSPTLTLTTVGDNVTVKVTYSVVFDRFERFLVGGGMLFEELIEVVGVDPPGSVTGRVLTAFGTRVLPVTAGVEPQTITRNRSIIVTRALLQEDARPGDVDELRCRININPVGMPIQAAMVTNEKTLEG